jgi:hypothetical protein
MAYDRSGLMQALSDLLADLADLLRKELQLARRNMRATGGEAASKISGRRAPGQQSSEASGVFARVRRRQGSERVAERSARLTPQTQASLQSSVQRVLREQPLAVAVVGLAVPRSPRYSPLPTPPRKRARESEAPARSASA